MSIGALVPRRKTTKILLAVVLLCSLFWVSVRVFGTRVLQRVPSPDDQFIAEVSEFRALSALDADYLTVELKKKWNPFGHGISGGLDYGAEISVSWIDSKTLVVRCTKCEKLGQSYREDRWGDISVRYIVQYESD